METDVISNRHGFKMLMVDAQRIAAPVVDHEAFGDWTLPTPIRVAMDQNGNSVVFEHWVATRDLRAGPHQAVVLLTHPLGQFLVSSFVFLVDGLQSLAAMLLSPMIVAQTKSGDLPITPIKAANLHTQHYQGIA